MRKRSLKSQDRLWFKVCLWASLYLRWWTVNGVSARFIRLILKHLRGADKAACHFNGARGPHPGPECLCCSYRTDRHSSATTLRPFFQQQNCWLAAQILPGWGLHGEKEQTAQLVVPPSNFLCAHVLWQLPSGSVLSGPEVGKSSLLGCIEAPGGRFGHPSIHSFVPDNAASQRRIQTALSEHLCTCESRRMLLSPAPRINPLKVTYAKVSLQFNGCSRLNQPPGTIKSGLSGIFPFDRILGSFTCVIIYQK